VPRVSAEERATLSLIKSDATDTRPRLVPMTGNDWVTFSWGTWVLVLLSGFLFIAFVD
jgi:hypothetical protein